MSACHFSAWLTVWLYVRSADQPSIQFFFSWGGGGGGCVLTLTGKKYNQEIWKKNQRSCSKAMREDLLLSCVSLRTKWTKVLFQTFLHCLPSRLCCPLSLSALSPQKKELFAQRHRFIWSGCVMALSGSSTHLCWHHSPHNLPLTPSNNSNILSALTWHSAKHCQRWRFCIKKETKICWGSKWPLCVLSCC